MGTRAKKGMLFFAEEIAEWQPNRKNIIYTCLQTLATITYLLPEAFTYFKPLFNRRN